MIGFDWNWQVHNNNSTSESKINNFDRGKYTHFLFSTLWSFFSVLYVYSINVRETFMNFECRMKQNFKSKQTIKIPRNEQTNEQTRTNNRALAVYSCTNCAIPHHYLFDTKFQFTRAFFYCCFSEIMRDAVCGFALFVCFRMSVLMALQFNICSTCI